MAVRLQPFGLVAGEVSDTSVCRGDLVKSMARDLIRTDSFRNESDAVRSLMWGGRYSTFDIALLAPDACQCAAQEVVAEEMSRP
ncbi:MAG: hypothetical protein PS018_17320 [bacterium]|nr:hypothetical protein [bacterium]